MSPLPPLLALAEGRKVRVRVRRAVGKPPREIVLHMDVARTLRAHICAGWQWGHIPSGELRDKRTAAKLKAMGAPKGWPDFMLLDPRAGLYCLEVKRIGEELRGEQSAFRLWCIRAGVRYCVAETMAEVLVIFADWRCLRNGAIAPQNLKGSGV